MALYHCSCKIVSRKTGRSAVGAAAYRSGTKLTNERDGITHDYTKKLGVVYSEILLPNNAPVEWTNREILWNAVEKEEKHNKAQLAREYELALPIELTKEEQIRILREYNQENFVNNGMCVDFSIHDGYHGHEIGYEADEEKEKETIVYEDGSNIKTNNPHAHILLTMRPIDENGVWLKKQEKVYILDKQGNKIYDKKSKTYKCRTIKTTNWDDKEFLECCRKNWAIKINQAYESKNLPLKVDHRSYKEQGIDKIPTIHIGKASVEMEMRRVKKKTKEQPDRIKIFRDIKEANKNIEIINKEISRTETHIDYFKILTRENNPRSIIDKAKQIRGETLEQYRLKSTLKGGSADQPRVPEKSQAIAQTKAAKDVSDVSRQLVTLRDTYKKAIIGMQKLGELCSEDTTYRKQAEQIRDCVKTYKELTASIEQLAANRDELRLFEGRKRHSLQANIDKTIKDRSSTLAQLAQLGVSDISQADKAIKENSELADRERDRAQNAKENQRVVGSRATETKVAFLALVQTVPVDERQAVLAEMKKSREQRDKGMGAYKAEIAAIRELDICLKPSREQERSRTKTQERNRGDDI